jgi:hypothetical protein
MWQKHFQLAGMMMGISLIRQDVGIAVRLATNDSRAASLAGAETRSP